MELASIIDHTLLKPTCTYSDIKRLCEEAQQYQFAAVCVPPFFVKDAVHLLKDSSIKVATVVGFPMGYATTPAKVEEVKRAIDEGADEVDAVINLCAVKNSNWAYVENDINSVTLAAHLKGKIVKIILETGALTHDEIKQLCDICNRGEVDFVKTSTGINAGGANTQVVKLLKSYLKDTIKIKASGGIRTFDAARALVEAGASRLGCSTGPQILN